MLRFMDPFPAIRQSARVSTSYRPPEMTDIRRLQEVTGGPLVSVLLATTPGDGLRTDDLVRTSALLAEVERRLRSEMGGRRAAAMADRCRALVIDILDEPVADGIALFVGQDVDEVFRLRHSPTERVVIDPTFATRELEYAARTSGRFRLLGMGSLGVRLYLGDHGAIDELHTSSFPMRSPQGIPTVDRSAMVREVAAGLRFDGAHRGVPIVMVGPRSVCEWVAELAELEPVGIVDVDAAELDEASLHVIGRSLMESQIARDRDHAFDLLDAAVIAGRAVVGLDDVWLAVKAGFVHTVVVDPTVARGAWVDPATHDVRWADDPTAPGVIDDLVDEMIELTVLSGGSVVFAEPGGLGDDGVAAIVASSPVEVPLDRFEAVSR